MSPSPQKPERTAKLRVLIVDDEPLARARVRAFLLSDPSVEVLGECANGIEALAAIRADRPDIAILDAQMPGCDGLQLLAQLPAEDRPAIILATAHERFAVEAFAVQVVDYLLKPFDRKRFEMAIQRAADHLSVRRASDLGRRVEGLLATAPRGPGRLAIRTEGRVVFLRTNEIAWVEAANNYSTLHLGGSRRLLLRETLSSLEKRLGPSGFARVSRSALVNVDLVKELQPAKYGDYV
ncbi:MAG TPA: LytTR family DNA-binding domain-containing protein, partial [Opitutaceae bacterium]